MNRDAESLRPWNLLPPSRSPRRSLRARRLTRASSLIGRLFMIGGDRIRVGDRSLRPSTSRSEDVIDELEIGGILGYRAESAKWSFMAEGAFVGSRPVAHGLSWTSTWPCSRPTPVTGSASVASLRGRPLHRARVRSPARDRSPARRSTPKNDDDFFDPLVGFRFATPLSGSGKWRAAGPRRHRRLRRLAWISPGRRSLDLGYRPNDHWSFWLGYRALAQDFDGEGKDGRFGMDVVYQGPQLGVAYTF